MPLAAVPMPLAAVILPRRPLKEGSWIELTSGSLTRTQNKDCSFHLTRRMDLQAEAPTTLLWTSRHAHIGLAGFPELLDGAWVTFLVRHRHIKTGSALRPLWPNPMYC